MSRRKTTLTHDPFRKSYEGVAFIGRFFLMDEDPTRYETIIVAPSFHVLKACFERLSPNYKLNKKLCNTVKVVPAKKKQRRKG